MSNKTSDKNVANVEEDVKVLKDLMKELKLEKQTALHNNEYGEYITECDVLDLYDMQILALQHILAEREQLLKERDVANDSVIAHKFAVMQQQIEQKDKRIQELEKESRKKSIELICYQEELENSIPTQVVIDKIKELKKRKNKYEYETQEIFLNAYYDRKRLEIIHKIDILQELLEGEI